MEIHQQEAGMLTMKAAGLGVLVSGMVALAAAPAHAGGGAGGGGTQIFASQCYEVAGGDNQGRVVTLADQFGERTGIRVGVARLLCTPTVVTLEEGEFDEVTGTADHVKCYALTPDRGPRVDVELTDSFDVETVRVQQARLLCLPAVKDAGGPVQ
jgi:hypothetical protein